jgi:hypothetical protein
MKEPQILSKNEEFLSSKVDGAYMVVKTFLSREITLMGQYSPVVLKEEKKGVKNMP